MMRAAYSVREVVAGGKGVLREGGEQVVGKAQGVVQGAGKGFGIGPSDLCLIVDPVGPKAEGIAGQGSVESGQVADRRRKESAARGMMQ